MSIVLWVFLLWKWMWGKMYRKKNHKMKWKKWKRSAIFDENIKQIMDDDKNQCFFTDYYTILPDHRDLRVLRSFSMGVNFASSELKCNSPLDNAVRGNTTRPTRLFSVSFSSSLFDIVAVYVTSLLWFSISFSIFSMYLFFNSSTDGWTLAWIMKIVHH